MPQVASALTHQPLTLLARICVGALIGALGAAALVERRSTRHGTRSGPSNHKATMIVIAILACMALTSCTAGGGPHQAAGAQPTPRPPRITAFPLPAQFDATYGIYHTTATFVNFNVSALTTGPGAKLWFTAWGIEAGSMEAEAGSVIGQLDANGKSALIATPSDLSLARDLTRAPDGNLWFTEEKIAPVGDVYASIIGRITPAGVITEFPIHLPGDEDKYVSIAGLSPGPDGTLWFMLQVENVCCHTITDLAGHITMSGHISLFALPDSNSSIGGSTIGPDGDLWFTASQSTYDPRSQTSRLTGAEIGHISPSGAVVEYPLPRPQGTPTQIVVGPDGALWAVVWFTSPLSDSSDILVRVALDGTISEYRVAGAQSSITGITAGPDGNLWFTTTHESLDDAQTHSDVLGRLTMRGALATFPLPPSKRYPGGLTIGPDGALWFVAGDAIGRVG